MPDWFPGKAHLDPYYAAWVQPYETEFVWFGVGLTIFSVAAFVGTLIAVPLVVARLPADYFISDRPHTPWGDRHPAMRTALVVGKNVLGGLILAGGVIMLVTPGQGLLSILIGLLLISFPGKRRLERFIVTRGPILRAVNAIRRRAGRAPFEMEKP